MKFVRHLGCYRGACKISGRLEKSKSEARGFDTWGDLALRRLIAQCIEAFKQTTCLRACATVCKPNLGRNLLHPGTSAENQGKIIHWCIQTWCDKHVVWQLARVWMTIIISYGVIISIHMQPLRQNGYYDHIGVFTCGSHPHCLSELPN